MSSRPKFLIISLKNNHICSRNQNKKFTDNLCEISLSFNVLAGFGYIYTILAISYRYVGIENLVNTYMHILCVIVTSIFKFKGRAFRDLQLVKLVYFKHWKDIVICNM